ncbi:hypothetical protein BU24DRAFT_452048 [Aaosphaeria arxii CBS 175.79]|uniref:Uncharacterized protein n=1 Tax=Aaosphaeria arxii CBS 175.79 TaxID=1450172 RepID=A0A6A5XSF7_9PLEO|nr:uncharacterized protein BU24DRAFT_452048 [Aaosphaeria arxii CBS 175.79]KAF2015194.1 hypothetical protein BU24DRAFT_452048 [Aaosphaeria arxii CBS 175.79]
MSTLRIVAGEGSVRSFLSAPIRRRLSRASKDALNNGVLIFRSVVLLSLRRHCPRDTNAKGHFNLLQTWYCYSFIISHDLQKMSQALSNQCSKTSGGVYLGCAVKDDASKLVKLVSIGICRRNSVTTPEPMRTKELSSTWDGSRRSRPEGLTTPKDGSRDPTSRGQSDQGDQALAKS